MQALSQTVNLSSHAANRGCKWWRVFSSLYCATKWL